MSDMKHTEASHTGLSRLLLTVVDVLIGALVFLLPFIMGGREAWGHWFLITVSLSLGVAWAVYAAVQGRRYSVSWLELFLIAGLSIAWFQVQPQPPEVMSKFSAEYTRLLPSWSETQLTETQLPETPSAESPTAWSVLSFAPVETRHAWWVFLAYAIVLTVLFQRIRQPEDCYRLLKWVGIAGVAMTTFGLLQWGASNDRFFWFYEHPYTEPTVHLKGAFTNRNHFAQFLSLAIGPLLWWLFRDVKLYLQTQAATNAGTTTPHAARPKPKRKSSRSQKPAAVAGSQAFQQGFSIPIMLLLCAVAIVVVAVVLSLSRGGMIAAGAVTLVALAGLWRGFKLGGAMAGIILGGGVLFLSLLAFSGEEQIQVKLDQLISGDADKIDTGGNRRAVWAADAKVIQKFPLLGTGVGSHRDVYTLYMDNYADFAMAEMTHAESSFVHAALETGLVGVGCLIAALLFVMLRLVRGTFRTTDPTNRACIIAVIACMVGAMLHAVVDFIWYVPGIVVVSLVLIAVGLKAASRHFGTMQIGHGQASGEIWFPRIAWAAMGALCVVGLIRVQPELLSRIEAEKHWYAALRVKLDVPPDDSDGYDNLDDGQVIALDEQPERLSPEAQAAYESKALARREVAMAKYLQERISHMHASLKARPDQHRVQLALAEQCVNLFDLLQSRSDNPFPLNMLRDAATNGGFETTQEMQEWIQGTCGKSFQLVKLADRLSRKSLQGCPLLGHAYVTLVETSFLHDVADSQHRDLVNQAMLVRGHDPRIRFMAGREAIMANDRETAMKLWDSVFHSSQLFRLNILQMVAHSTPVEFWLQQFQPNAEELRDILLVYESLKRERDVNVTLERLADAIPKEAGEIEDEDERLEALMFAYMAARRIEDLEHGVEILRRTAKDFPLAFEPRYHLGMTLVELERPEDSMPHLQWCYEHDPGNVLIPRLIVRARSLMNDREDDSKVRLANFERWASRTRKADDKQRRLP